MKDDNFDSPSKSGWRDRNVEFIRRSLSLRSGKLPGAYVDLLGQSGHLAFQELTASGILCDRSSGYIGVDCSVNNVEDHRVASVPFRTIRGRMAETLMRLVEEGTRISVVSYDGYALAASPKWWGHDGRILADVAWRVADVCGSLVVITNHSARALSHARAPDHLRMALKCFQSFFPELISADVEEEVYTSKRSPMVTLRIALRLAQ